MHIHAHTPHLFATDSRGLPVRQVAYWREDARAPETRNTTQQHDAAARLVAQRDPRLMSDPSAPANLTTSHSLTGQVLSTVSVDAGWRVMLPGEANQTLHSWDGGGSQRVLEYDEQIRVVAISEQALGGEPLCVERYEYGGDDPAFAARNQCGQLIRHDDPAGTQLFEQFGLTGGVLQQTRHFLRTLEAPDWPESLAERDALLEPGEGAISRTVLNPLGETIRQTDAKGNQQFFGLTRDGQLREVRLQLSHQAQAKTLVSAIQYNADGRTAQETAGNGVITTLQYAPDDGRLTRLQARGGNDLLQDLRYAYDPVGNVLSIEDAALPIRYFANQRIEPVSHFDYDSLYQLIKATGCEAGQTSTFSPFADPAACANYTQTYRYDRAGNLLELTHEGPQSHGHRLIAAAHSNRCLPVRDGAEPGEEDFRNGFDANGNLLSLQPGQWLSWDICNQLRKVRTVVRAVDADDGEQYIYGADGMRVRKIRQTQTNVRTLTAEVRYLPNLEIRTHSGTGERLQVISVQAGRSSVRVLHWESEPPKEVENDQQRYSLNDHLGSCTLELDAEGQVISHERYHPFGTTAWFAGRGEIEASYKTLRYSGKEQDATGLYYYGFRYYAAQWQRWLNPDPSGIRDGLNVYDFCGNNPTSRMDPDGLMMQDVDEIGPFEQFLSHEQSLRADFGLPSFSFRLSDGGDDEMSMNDEPSPGALSHQGSAGYSNPGTPQSQGSPGSPGSPGTPSTLTAEQGLSLNILTKDSPELRHSWNSRNLLERDNFGGKVYRADLRPPDQVIRYGFNPSSDFRAIKKMIGGSALIVAETLEGAVFYAARSGHEYEFYEIDATDVRGASLVENLVLNHGNLVKHLDGYADVSPTSLTGEANEMREAHLYHDDLFQDGRPSIVALGPLRDRVLAARLRQVTPSQ